MPKLFEKFGDEEREEMLKNAVKTEKPAMISLPDEFLDGVAGGDDCYKTDTPCPDCGYPMNMVTQTSIFNNVWALFCPMCLGTAKDGWWNYE